MGACIIRDNRHYPLTVPNATETDDGAMSSADKAKLDALSVGVQIPSYTDDTRPVNPDDGTPIRNRSEIGVDFLSPEIGVVPPQGGLLQIWNGVGFIPLWQNSDGRPSLRDFLVTEIFGQTTSGVDPEAWILDLNDSDKGLNATAADVSGNGHTGTYGAGWTQAPGLQSRTGKNAALCGDFSNNGTLSTDGNVAFSGPNNDGAWTFGMWGKFETLPQTNLIHSSDNKVLVSFAADGSITTKVNNVAGPAAPAGTIAPGRSFSLFLQRGANGSGGGAGLVVSGHQISTAANVAAGTDSPLIVTHGSTAPNAFLQCLFFTETDTLDLLAGAILAPAVAWAIHTSGGLA